MFAFREIRLESDDRGQPGVALFHDKPVVDEDDVAARHGLAAVKFECVEAVRVRRELAGEGVVAAEFASSAGRRGDLDGLALSFGDFLQFDGRVGGVELRAAVIVPEQAVSGGGVEERHGRLRVDLDELAGLVLDVQDAVLELAEAELEFRAGRYECRFDAVGIGGGVP